MNDAIRCLYVGGDNTRVGPPRRAVNEAPLVWAEADAWAFHWCVPLLPHQHRPRHAALRNVEAEDGGEERHRFASGDVHQHFANRGEDAVGVRVASVAEGARQPYPRSVCRREDGESGGGVVNETDEVGGSQRLDKNARVGSGRRQLGNRLASRRAGSGDKEGSGEEDPHQCPSAGHGRHSRL